MLRTTAALIYAGLVAATFSASGPKCSASLDEMNCVNATIGDLPNVTHPMTKDVKFLKSYIPLIRKGDFVNFPNMTDFVCLDCQILVIEQDALWGSKNLIRIELYGNNMTTVNMNLVTNCRKLKDFILSWNPDLQLLNDRPFLISSSMTHLDLTGNEIAEVPALSFAKLPSLKSLSLAGNLLHYLPVDVFSALKNLRSLDISRNKFRFLSLSVFPSRIRNIRLAWNPWTCDCSLFPVIQWSKTRETDEEAKCYQPRRLKWSHFDGSNCTTELVEVIRQRKLNGTG